MVKTGKMLFSKLNADKSEPNSIVAYDFTLWTNHLVGTNLLYPLGKP